MTATEDVETGHKDRVTVLDINFDGSKILTASMDHRIKIWNVDQASGGRRLIETVTAHDADIRDAKWFHPSTGTHLATIGNDLKCHIWQDDPHQAPNSGRRYQKIFTIPNKARVPFVSLDLKNIDNVYTVLALIDRQGLVSIYEPTNPDEFKDWTLVDQFSVCIPPPGRGEQTCFKVRFDQNVTPLPYMNFLSDDRRQLSLVVTAMNEVKIYRSVDTSNSEVTVGGPEEASHRLVFYEAAKLAMHPALVRDVQWAPFNVRGTDLFATACKDGAVRIFELSLSENIDSRGSEGNSSTNRNQPQTSTLRTPANLIRQQPHQSSLTTAITSRNQNQNVSSSNQPPQTQSSLATTSPNQSKSSTRTTHKFPYTTHITLQANLENAHDDAWSVIWDPQAQILMSGGSDGATKIWRKGILDGYHRQSQGGDVETTGQTGGRWMLFADQAVEFGDAVDDGEFSEGE